MVALKSLDLPFTIHSGDVSIVLGRRTGRAVL